MKQLLVVLVLPLLPAPSALCQYAPQSEYLKDPARNVAIVVQEAEFWKHAKDPVNGGFFCFVDRQGYPLLEADMRSTIGGYWYLPGATSGSNADSDEAAWIARYKANWPQGIVPYFTKYDAKYGYEPIQFNYVPKSVIGNSRVAYVFTRAFMVTGQEEYLQLARDALDWLYAHGWNAATQGWWYSTDEYGTPKALQPSIFGNNNLYKWSYNQMYPLVGIAAINEATQGTRLSPSSEQEPAAADRQWLTKGIQVIDQNLYDSREGHEGYFANADYDWTEPTGKGFTPTVDGITTHAAAASLLLQQPYYTQRFLRLADEAVAHVVQSMDDPRVKVGFAEGYDGNWNINPADTYNDIGHVLKTAWCLGRAYLVAPKPEYKQAARRLISEVLAHGYDHVNGGPYRTYNWAEGGIWHDAYYDGHGKNQWMMEQAINAGLINYYIADQPADKDQYLKMADQTMDFYVKYMVDWAYGGVWESVTDDGSQKIENFKGNIWDQGYHASELGYCAYLYGSLLYRKQPITLYYHFDPANYSRAIQLNPLEAGEGLHIENAELAGRAFAGFSPHERVLNLPPGIGGTFKVTFTLIAESERNANRLINISTRSLVGTSDNVQIAGFVISGSTPKKVVIRASGPVLAANYGVAGVLADPMIELHRTGVEAPLSTNDDWDSALASDFAAVGAFAWNTGSKDAALVTTLDPGMYTVVVKGKNRGTGVALIEVYDADTGTPGSKLINISTRSMVGTSDNVQIAGFVVSGSAPKKLVIRASGPVLATNYGVTGVLADPMIELHNQNTGATLATNDDWDSALASDFAAVGAFAWNAGSKDAAMVTTLDPGQYTVVVKGKNSGTGVALIEVYEEP